MINISSHRDLGETLKDDDIYERVNNKSIHFNKDLFRIENIVPYPTDSCFLNPGIEQLFSKQIKINNLWELIQVTV